VAWEQRRKVQPENRWRIIGARYVPIAVGWLRNERALGIAKEGGGIEDLTLYRIDAVSARDASDTESR